MVNGYSKNIAKVKSNDVIVEYYNGSEVFITGGTGCVGKSLVEKLLRSCPGIEKIYLLLRSKREQTAAERLEKFKTHIIFDVIRKDDPKILDKLDYVSGDISEIRLGLSDADIEKLQNVSFIFHVAATIRFDEAINRAIILNVRGTREILLLAEKLKNLRMFMHVSTLYSNCYSNKCEEKIYPPVADWRKFIQLAETVDPFILNTFTPKILGKFPNTYSFTKHLSEYVANDFRHTVPLIIFRPSIVIVSLEEPIPGYYDCFQGPIGLLAVIASGVCRTLYMKDDLSLDLTPLDVCSKLAISSMWYFKANPPKPVDDNAQVINVSSNAYYSAPIGEMMKQTLKIIEEKPMLKSLGRSSAIFTVNRHCYITRVFLLQLLPAVFLDMLLKLFGQKPILMKIQRRLFLAQQVLQYFMFRQFSFECGKLKKLIADVGTSEEFDVQKYTGTNIYGFAPNCYKGARFLLKEKDEDIPIAKRNDKIFKYVGWAFKGLFYCYLTKFIYTNIPLMS